MSTNDTTNKVLIPPRSKVYLKRHNFVKNVKPNVIGVMLESVSPPTTTFRSDDPSLLDSSDYGGVSSTDFSTDLSDEDYGDLSSAETDSYDYGDLTSGTITLSDPFGFVVPAWNVSDDSTPQDAIDVWEDVGASSRALVIRSSLYSDPRDNCKDAYGNITNYSSPWPLTRGQELYEILVDLFQSVNESGYQPKIGSMNDKKNYDFLLINNIENNLEQFYAIVNDPRFYSEQCVPSGDENVTSLVSLYDKFQTISATTDVEFNESFFDDVSKKGIWNKVLRLSINYYAQKYIESCFTKGFSNFDTKFSFFDLRVWRSAAYLDSGTQTSQIEIPKLMSMDAYGDCKAIANSYDYNGSNPTSIVSDSISPFGESPWIGLLHTISKIRSTNNTSNKNLTHVWIKTLEKDSSLFHPTGSSNKYFEEFYREMIFHLMVNGVKTLFINNEMSSLYDSSFKSYMIKLIDNSIKIGNVVLGGGVSQFNTDLISWNSEYIISGCIPIKDYRYKTNNPNNILSRDLVQNILGENAFSTGSVLSDTQPKNTWRISVKPPTYNVNSDHYTVGETESESTTHSRSMESVIDAQTKYLWRVSVKSPVYDVNSGYYTVSGTDFDSTIPYYINPRSAGFWVVGGKSLTISPTISFNSIS
jgi:hypothetical protein